MELTSTEGAALVGVRCDTAGRIEIRAPDSSRPLVELSLPPGEKLLLAPKAYRVVLRGVARTLKLGDYVPMVLIVQVADGSRRRSRSRRKFACIRRPTITATRISTRTDALAVAGRYRQVVPGTVKICRMIAFDCVTGATIPASCTVTAKVARCRR